MLQEIQPERLSGEKHTLPPLCIMQFSMTSQKIVVNSICLHSNKNLLHVNATFWSILNGQQICIRCSESSLSASSLVRVFISVKEGNKSFDK